MDVQRLGWHLAAGGIHYYSQRFDNDDHAWQLVFNAEAAFLLSPWRGFTFTVGPAFDIGMAGKYVDENPGDPDIEWDLHAHSFGIATVGVAGYFVF